jgi:hypothetical protein
MRQVKLAWTGTLRAPLEQKLPVSAELHHPGVLVAVAHVKRPVASHGNRSRAIEMTDISPATPRPQSGSGFRLPR